jgi:anti-sigma factor RsiW
MKSCYEYPDLMMRQLDGALNLAEQSALDAHLRDCSRCASDFGYLRMADGLLRAVDAPNVNAEEWAAAEAEVAKAAGAEDGLGVIASVTEPPAVSRDEWDGVWRGIEREALLQTDESRAIDIREARRRSVWRYAAAVAVAAVVVLGVYIIMGILLAPPPSVRPPVMPDKVAVGNGYAYATVKTESADAIYIVAQVNNMEYISASTSGDYLYSTHDGGVEVASKGTLPGNKEPVVVPPKP